MKGGEGGKKWEEGREEGGKKGEEEEGESRDMIGSIATGLKPTQMESWYRPQHQLQQVRPVVPEPLSAMIGG